MRMRFKNFTLLFLMGLFGLTTANLFAQEDATIAPENIKYWIGEGANEVIFIGNWNQPDTALAWGYRFNEETLMVKDVLDAITEVDSRLAYEAAEGWFSNLTFNDGVLDLTLVGGWWMFNVNGITAGYGYDAQPVVNGDVIKFGDESCGIITDPEMWTYVWTKEVAPVYPLAEEATVDPSEIHYWVGEGQNEVIFAVNWNDPDTCLAWGYRFNNPAVLVKEVMDAIAEKDNRLAYAVGDWGVTDITYNSGDVHLALSGMYWLFNVNGVMADYGYDAMPVKDGDFIKWGDESCATEIAPWSYVWETPVTPVYDNTDVAEQTAGATLYPNPASTYTMLSVQEMAAEAMVTIADLQGRVLSRFAVNQHGEPIRVETECLAPGLYFVTVSDGTRCQTMKLTVK